jgi:hypothetical protein
VGAVALAVSAISDDAGATTAHHATTSHH